MPAVTEPTRIYRTEAGRRTLMEEPGQPGTPVNGGFYRLRNC